MQQGARAGKIFGGVLWGVGGTAGQAAFQMVVFIILARALSPASFGIVAIATAIIDLLNFIGRGGIAEVLIQRKDLDRRSLNSGFAASIVAGAILSIGLYALAPAFARMFKTVELKPVMELLSPVCVLYASGAVYEAMLRHSYQFKQLALRNTTATIVSGIASIIMALNGFGVYALIAQRLIATIWNQAAMMVATRWLPGTGIDLRDMTAQLKQGSAIALSSVLGVGNQRLLDLVVGYFLGPVKLGYLRIAWRILDLLMEIAVRPISNVSLTSLSKAKHDGRGVNEDYLSLLRYSSIFITPMFLGFATVSYDVIPLVFGSKWLVSGGLLSILTFIGIFVPLIYFKSNALIAHGRYRHVLILNSIEFTLSIILAFTFAPFGLVSAAIGNVVRTALATPIILLYLRRVAGIPALASVRAAMPAVLSALGMLLATYLVKTILPPAMSPFIRLGVVIAVGAAAYCGLIVLLDRRLVPDVRQFRRRT